MPFISTADDSHVTGDAAAIYGDVKKAVGYVPNYVRVFASRPAVYRAWGQLNGAIKASSDLRRYELATLAAARKLRSSYCSLAHGKILAEKFYDAEQVPAFPAGLEPVDVAVMELAEKVVTDATSVTAADIDRLKSFGLSDDDILDVVLAAAARCFFSKTLDALGVQPDAAYRSLSPSMRDALTVGRPIETA